MNILLIEPYDGGSHAYLWNGLTYHLPCDVTRLGLPARKWKWRMRGAALHWSHTSTLWKASDYDLLIASSFLNLSEFLGMNPQLADVPTLLYFHENQLAYPVVHHDDRDFHFPLIQISSALAATTVAFNSCFHRDEFLDLVDPFLARFPDYQPREVAHQLREKSIILPVPIREDEFLGVGIDRGAPPLILWNHRWEHDKQPEEFFGAIRQLAAEQIPFRLAVVGETFRDCPSVFHEAQKQLDPYIVQWGYVENRKEYIELLQHSDIVVSTARQEYFGISIMEAVWAGARPVVPDRLVYPELYPEAYRYADTSMLENMLRDLLTHPEQLCDGEHRRLAEPYLWSKQKQVWWNALSDIACDNPRTRTTKSVTT